MFGFVRVRDWQDIRRTKLEKMGEEILDLWQQLEIGKDEQVCGLRDESYHDQGVFSFPCMSASRVIRRDFANTHCGSSYVSRNLSHFSQFGL